MQPTATAATNEPGNFQQLTPLRVLDAVHPTSMRVIAATQFTSAGYRLTIRAEIRMDSGCLPLLIPSHVVLERSRLCPSASGQALFPCANANTKQLLLCVCVCYFFVEAGVRATADQQ